LNKVYDEEVLAKRASELGARNGIRLVFVTLDPPAPATAARAFLDVEFYNSKVLAAILSDVSVNGVPPAQICTLRGGIRIPAGDDNGRTHVTGVAAGSSANTLRLTVEPVGDYSTYTLALRDPALPSHPFPGIDPIFHEIAFKFRPGCFNVNCAPTFPKTPPPSLEPIADYLAKDYDSFKHVLIGAMQVRVPGWEPTSEADLDQVLIDLVAARADELSDFQDRVANEAFLATARKRLSLARHARLMDYHIHQGNQATTWLALEVNADTVAAIGFGAWTGRDWTDDDAVIFVNAESRRCFTVLNALSFYHWQGLVTALERGATEAELRLPAPLSPAVQADADTLRDLLRSGDVRQLLIQQWLNPETGTPNGRDPHARQLLRLLEGAAAAESVFDPAANEWCVRARWRAEDRLTRRYCFLLKTPGRPPIEDAALLHGNLTTVAQGRPHVTTFRPPEAPLAPADATAFIAKAEAHYERTRWGTLCALPQSPLAYRDTPPGGDSPPRSTLEVRVDSIPPWNERSDLIESEGDDQDYLVETDEHQTSRVRFGNGINGQSVPEGATVTCSYQVGGGARGNVGVDTILHFDAAHSAISKIWNPFDVTNGREPEPVAEIVRRAPEAYRQRQRRAVTLEDYERRAEDLPTVAHAAAHYAWTGSWRTVRIAIDAKGTTTLSEDARRAIETHLNALRLIGEDLEIRPAKYLPLDVKLTLCAHPHYWPADLDFVLQQEFSDGYMPDGRPGFFHPDNWTFGQPLHASQLIGRAVAVPGVERVLSVSIRRLHGVTGPSLQELQLAPQSVPVAEVDTLPVDAFEIIQVANDPDHLEKGRILFDIRGGRR
jgi:hypothetical protein